jgi:stage V sporulation protein K
VQVLPKKEWGQVLKEINSEFVGLDAIKANAQKIVLRQQFDAARETNGLANSQQNHSTVFLGNPGLGKTTFARKKAELLHALGLSGPNYVEVSRENIVGGFIGHTENKMTALFEAADIIFIDEAYSLNDGRPDSGDCGKKVIDALVPALENNPKLTVFMAGYPEEMDKLIACNPGLRSRLTRYETFEDMNKEQLGQTLDHMLAKEGLTIDADAREKVLQELDKSREALGKRNFGNARLVRNVVRQLPELMADRIFGSQSGSLLVQCPDKDALQRATLADINAMDFSAVLGTPKAAASEKEAWEPSIGFGAKLKNMGPKKG